MKISSDLIDEHFFPSSGQPWPLYDLVSVQRSEDLKAEAWSRLILVIAAASMDGLAFGLGLGWSFVFIVLVNYTQPLNI